MNVIEISAAGSCAPTLALGKRGENLATEVHFDFSSWLEEFGEGRVELYARRCGDENPYPVIVTVEGQEAVWTLTATDTHVVGYGTAEFVWIAGEAVVKSVVYGTIVEPDIGQPTDTPPEPYESWLDTLTELAADTQEYAERAETAQGKAEDAQAGAEAAQAATEEALGPVREDVDSLMETVDITIGVTARGLPAGYTEKWFLTNTGNAMIDTGVGWVDHPRIVMDVYSEGGHVFGEKLASSRRISGGIGASWYYGGSRVTADETSDYLRSRVTFDYSDTFLKVNGVTVSTFDATGATGTNTSGIRLFGAKGDGSGMTDTFAAAGTKIFGAKMFTTSDGVESLIFDAVPCVRDSDGTAGFYDLIGEAFHGAETGTLVAAAFPNLATVDVRVGDLESEMDEAQAEIDDIGSLIPAVSLQLIEGRYIKRSDGNTASNDSYTRTDWIALGGVKKLLMTVPVLPSSTAVNTVAAIAFYSESKKEAFLSSVPCILGTEDGLQPMFVDVPAGAKFARCSMKSTTADGFYVKVSTAASPDAQLMAGVTVAILGDSLSTNGNTGPQSNVPEILITEEDIGVELKAYLTFDDTHTHISGLNWEEKTLTIGGVDFTSAQMGQEITFTPNADDVGKCVGMPHNYNSNSLTTWWEHASKALGFDPIPVCWSGASFSAHEYDQPMRMCSYAWHESQIRKCGIRTPGSMERTAPDVIILFRGPNDMTHTPYTKLTEGYFAPYDWEYPTTDEIDGGYGFKEAICLTVAKLREAYPCALLMICTFNTFKRVNYSHFPVNNGINSLPQYNAAIRECAEFLGMGVINFDRDGITFENCYIGGYSTDSPTQTTHPSNKGHAVMGQRAINDIKRWYQDMTP